MYSRFAELMERKGVRPYDVAKATNIRQSMFTDWKMGRYTPKIDKLEKIAAYFNVPVEYLLTGKVTEGTPLNDATARIAQAIYSNKELSVLFDLAVDSNPHDVKMASDMLRRMKAYNDAINAAQKWSEKK